MKKLKLTKGNTYVHTCRIPASKVILSLNLSIPFSFFLSCLFVCLFVLLRRRYTAYVYIFVVTDLLMCGASQVVGKQCVECVSPHMDQLGCANVFFFTHFTEVPEGCVFDTLPTTGDMLSLLSTSSLFFFYSPCIPKSFFLSLYKKNSFILPPPPSFLEHGVASSSYAREILLLGILFLFSLLVLSLFL